MARKSRARCCARTWPSCSGKWFGSTVWVCAPAVIVAVRDAALVLVVTEYAIVPDSPVPEDPLVMVSHAALDVAVHPQVVPFVVIDTLPVPPAAAKLAVAGVTAVTAHAAASCVTVCTCAPAVIVAVREAALVLTETE